MTAVSPSPLERARKVESTILQALSSPGTQAAIAVVLGLSESTISRMKNDHLGTFCAVLAHAGLKVVPAAYRCVDPEKMAALSMLLDAALRKQSPVDLMWDDDS